MKILHVIDTMAVGGAQKMVYDFVLRQKKYGHDVSVLSLIQSDSFLETDIIKQGIEMNFIYPLTASIRKIYNPLTVLKLGKYIKGVDVVHVHLFPANYWCAIYKFLFNRKLKLITTEHSTNNKRRNKEYLKPIERFVYGRYNAVVACSEKAQKTLNAFLGKNMVKFISNGVNVGLYHDAESYSKKEAYGVDGQIKIVTMVARFHPPKDQATLVRSLKFLPEYVHAAFVGDGDMRKNCECLAKDIGMEKRCHFLGLRSDVPRLVKTSDINMLSSKWEGLSLSSVECMSTAKPFIGTNVQGIKEIVKGAGLLFEYENAEELASCISRLLESKELYKSVSEKCYTRALEYDISKAYNAYIECYQNL